LLESATQVTATFLVGMPLAKSIAKQTLGRYVATSSTDSEKRQENALSKQGTPGLM
jgi:hypothetical protein